MSHCPRCHAPLPDPPERFCPSCGADLALLPPPIPAGGASSGGWAPGPGDRAGTPWERRDQIGFAAALVETTQQVLTSPAALFHAMAVTGGVGSPLLYALIVGYAGVVISSIYNFVIVTVMGSGFANLGSLGNGNEAVARLMPYAPGGMGLGMILLLGPVYVVIWMFVIAGIVHLALMVLGGAARGFEATFRVACYSEAAALLNIIPVCGGMIGPVVMLVLMIIGIAEAHGTTRARAAAAVLLPIVLCCCCLLIPIVGFVASLASQMK